MNGWIILFRKFSLILLSMTNLIGKSGIEKSVVIMCWIVSWNEFNDWNEIAFLGHDPIAKNCFGRKTKPNKERSWLKLDALGMYYDIQWEPIWYWLICEFRQDRCHIFEFMNIFPRFQIYVSVSRLNKTHSDHAVLYKSHKVYDLNDFYSKQLFIDTVFFTMQIHDDIEYYWNS